MPSRKLKVLFLANDCNPQWHSLPALIAEYFRSLLPHVDATLVTNVRNREQLEPWLPEGVEVVYVDAELIAGPFFRLAQWLTGDPNKAMTLQAAFSYPGNLYFEYRVWRKFKKALQAGDYDLVHRASPMSPAIPSPIAKRCPLPFVIGPILGGLPWPKEFHGEMRREREWMNYFRVAHRWMPYYKSSYRHAAAILAGYAHTVADIPEENHNRVVEFSEGAVHPEDYPALGKPLREKLTVLFVGRLVPFKQPEVLIRCFQDSELLRQHQLVIVGDGPELPRLRTLVKDLNLESWVQITGTLPVAEVRGWMQEADIFAFPSIREQGGGVITMASMSFMPCVVVDYGGPSVRVPDGCGIKVPMGNVDAITRSFTLALEKLVTSPEQRQQMGKSARKFTEKYYSWEWKARKTLAVYRWVLGERRDKPDYWAEL